MTFSCALAKNSQAHWPENAGNGGWDLGENKRGGLQKRDDQHAWKCRARGGWQILSWILSSLAGAKPTRLIQPVDIGKLITPLRSLFLYSESELFRAVCDLSTLRLWCRNSWAMLLVSSSHNLNPGRFTRGLSRWIIIIIIVCVFLFHETYKSLILGGNKRRNMPQKR